MADFAMESVVVGGKMVQRHSIILWKKADKSDKSFEEIAKETYAALNLFQDYPWELRPNYLTAKPKKDIKKFDWNYENFNNVLKRGISKEGKNVFEDLGYSISFFSSMNGQDSSAFEVIAGNKNEKFYNTLIIHLPLSLNLYDKKAADSIKNLFKRLVGKYMPYWGCISNRILSRRYGKFLEGALPTALHWLNYWSEDIVQTIRMEKIQKIVETNPAILFENGILSIKDTALDADRADDIRFYDEIQKQFFSEKIQYLIDKIINLFSDIFGKDMLFIKTLEAIEYMGYFKIQYKYLPSEYDTERE